MASYSLKLKSDILRPYCFLPFSPQVYRVIALLLFPVRLARVLRLVISSSSRVTLGLGLHSLGLVHETGRSQASLLRAGRFHPATAWYNLRPRPPHRARASAVVGRNKQASRCPLDTKFLKQIIQESAMSIDRSQMSVLCLRLS